MPHTNPPAPFMPRLEQPEADSWYAKVKAVPANSPKFDCILPGCPNAYQTKQGLERHFVSIHMPKSDSPSSRTGYRPLASSGHTSGGRRIDNRKSQLLPRRRGRPPSGLKARLKQIGLQHGIAYDAQPEHHTNHSLLASHPASARHDHGGDDEHKPREERSYLEFFPFLNTTLRLDIVNIEETAHRESDVGDEGSLSQKGKVSMSVTDEGAIEKAAIAQSATEPSASEDTSGVGAVAPHPESVGLTEKMLIESQSLTVSKTAGNNRPGMDLDDDPDGGAASESDVFFDAKGFLETEAESGQKAVSSRGDVKDESSIEPVQEGTASMELDQDTALDEASASTVGNRVAGDSERVQHHDLDDMEVDDNASVQDSGLRTATGEPSAPSTTKELAAETAAVTALEPKTLVTMLPRSSFRRIPPEDEELDEYHLPIGHNVRYIEPTETELAERVEYDMDEQDEFWLKEINAERRKQDFGEITASMFEKIIDRLEKEWFDLTKNIPKPAENLPPEDSACNICDDGECENSNAIVFCDGCNLAVHQDCYGIPYIPEGQWLCRKCMLSPQMPVSCIFCPSEGGAFKQTTNSRWAHLLCASWIPEVGVANTVYMEPIDNIDKIPASRWRLTCYICKLRVGACIQCETKNCFRAFHVTCARKAHLYMKSKLSKVSNSAGEVLVYRAHCHKHTPRDYKGVVDIAGAAAVFARKGLKKKRAKIRILDDDSDDPDYRRSDEDETSADRRSLALTSNKGSVAMSALPAASSLAGSRTSKAALAHQKHYSPGAPLAPMFIVNRLLPFVSKLGAKTPALRKTSALNFIFVICKYWSLKRESRRGAPLLKRLHLEPWTASASAHRQTEEEKLKKLQTQLLLRGDLEKVRMLAELVRKRERAKLKRQELQNRYLCKIMFPLKTILEDTLAELEKLDKQKYFAYPISAEEVKDYHEVIKNPICFQTMNEKLIALKYRSVEEFADDARQIYQNCLTYNKVDTPYYRAASRQSKQAEPLLERAKEDYGNLEIDPRTGFLAVPIDTDILTYDFVPFPKQAESDIGQRLGTPAAVASPATALSGEGGRKSARRVSLVEPPKVPFVSGRSLRATASRTAQSAGSSSPNQAAPALRSSKEIQRGLDQTPGFRAPSRTAARHEVAKLSTATKTRADAAKARTDAGKAAIPSKLSDEQDLLEQLKTKSKKSRSLALSLQSRLKPSIVDKAVVINKPAPKGWAYVVVEGEEDTSEGEEEDSNRAVNSDESQELVRAKEEARLKRQMERQKKKLAKEAKAKARAESYARFKALKALAATEESKTIQTAANTSDSSIAAHNTRAKHEAENAAQSAPAKTRSRARRGKDEPSFQDARIGSKEEHTQGAGLDGGVATQVGRGKKRGSHEAGLPVIVDGKEGPQDSSSTGTSSSALATHSVKRSRRQSGEMNKANIDDGEATARGNRKSGAKSVASRDQDLTDEIDSHSVAEEGPPKNRPKRFGPGRTGAEGIREEEEGGDDGVSVASTRRLRSAEVAAAVPDPPRTRRGSSGGQKSVTRSGGEHAAATKRRRNDGTEGVSKKPKSDKYGQGAQLSYGSLVWAKMEGFPWFPAELMNPRGPRVPRQALDLEREGSEAHLVQFFDLRERGERGRSWYWVAPSQTIPLGVDLDEDRKRVHLKASWNPKRRKSVKEAYIDACLVRGIDASAVIAESS
ncbi:nuA3 HAT complex component nto1 [Mortierella sp. GBA30]|nr:nuA3 HAT complex component nto1 [Mortierella sp. GBA30]